MGRSCKWWDGDVEVQDTLLGPSFWVLGLEFPKGFFDGPSWETRKRYGKDQSSSEGRRTFSSLKEFWDGKPQDCHENLHPPVILWIFVDFTIETSIAMLAFPIETSIAIPSLRAPEVPSGKDRTLFDWDQHGWMLWVNKEAGGRAGFSINGGVPGVPGVPGYPKMVGL